MTDRYDIVIRTHSSDEIIHQAAMVSLVFAADDDEYAGGHGKQKKPKFGSLSVIAHTLG